MVMVSELDSLSPTMAHIDDTWPRMHRLRIKIPVKIG